MMKWELQQLGTIPKKQFLNRKFGVVLVFLIVIVTRSTFRIDLLLYNNNDEATTDFFLSTNRTSLSPMDTGKVHKELLTIQSKLVTTTRKRRPIRVLLGITNVLAVVSKYERRRRHLVRNTYLQYYDSKRQRSIQLSNVPNIGENRSICSLQEYRQWLITLSDPTTTTVRTNDDKKTCQLVYTFIFGTTPHKNNKMIQQMAKVEQDSLLLHRDSPKNGNDITMAWFQYALELMNDVNSNATTTSSQQMGFDFVAKVTSQHIIYPDEFLQSPLEDDDDDDTLENSSLYDKAVVVYSRKDCKEFIMLSPKMTNFALSNSSLENHDKPIDDPERWLESRVQSYPDGYVQPSFQSWNGVSSTTLEGSVYDFLTKWDQYYISNTEYIDPAEISLVQSSQAKIVAYPQGEKGSSSRHRNQKAAATSPRLLLGIFTTESDIERLRRQTIRNTYLNYYTSQTIVRGVNTKRICSLFDLLSQKVEEEEKCQLSYVFVIGANETGPTELVDFDPIQTSLTIQPPTSSSSSEEQFENNDIVYLNIRENMVDGKTQTWFKYASTILESHYFDYIGKTDTDTVLFIDDFLEQRDPKGIGLWSLPTFPHNIRVYAGEYRQPSIKFPYPAFMHGKFYFLSPDLIRFIISPSCNRTALYYPSECITISNFAHSHPLPIQRWRIPSHYWAHPVKNVRKFQEVYQQWLWNRTNNITPQPPS